MSAQPIPDQTGLFPSVLHDFFRPWSTWFDRPAGDIWGSMFCVPAVNIMENKESFIISMAIPGMKKEYLHIDIEGSLITVSGEAKLETKNKEGVFTRKEYNYSSFSRSFTLPEAVVKDKIIAGYENGELTLTLPKTEDVTKAVATHITVL